jgi:hypothetical protein
MDNLRAHKAAGRRETSEQAGAQGIAWPPASPAWSPMAPGGATLQTAWRTAPARTREALEPAIAQALATSTVADAHGWFAHAGYTLQ